MTEEQKSRLNDLIWKYRLRNYGYPRLIDTENRRKVVTTANEPEFNFVKYNVRCEGQK